MGRFASSLLANAPPDVLNDVMRGALGAEVRLRGLEADQRQAELARNQNSSKQSLRESDHRWPSAQRACRLTRSAFVASLLQADLCEASDLGDLKETSEVLGQLSTRYTPILRNHIVAAGFEGFLGFITAPGRLTSEGLRTRGAVFACENLPFVQTRKTAPLWDVPHGEPQNPEMRRLTPLRLLYAGLDARI
ncbi:MAG: hypothetical protein AAGA48_18840 [Myxococcota bacterium]